MEILLANSGMFTYLAEATLVFIWSCVCGHLVNNSPIFTFIDPIDLAF